MPRAHRRHLPPAAAATVQNIVTAVLRLIADENPHLAHLWADMLDRSTHGVTIDGPNNEGYYEVGTDGLRLLLLGLTPNSDTADVRFWVNGQQRQVSIVTVPADQP